MEGNYCPEDYFAAVRGLEEMPEGGARCQICFEMRLREAARVAKAIGADWFTTTLTVGSKKDARLLNELGTKIEAETGVPYLHYYHSFSRISCKHTHTTQYENHHYTNA